MFDSKLIKVLALSGSLTILAMDLTHADGGVDYDVQDRPVAVNFSKQEVADAFDFAQIAYHTYDEQSSDLDKRQRFADDIARLKAEGYTDIQVLKGVTGNFLYKTESNLGIVARRGDTLHVAFRGTKFNSLSDILTDINIFKTAFKGLGSAHTGFNNAYGSVEKQLNDIIMTLFNAGQISKISFKGHSLGGAVARLGALDVAARIGKNVSVKIATFNEPRSGGHTLAMSSDDLVGKENHVRLVKGRDIVGSGANVGIAGNKHVGQKIVIEETGYNPVKQHSLESLRDSPDAVEKHNAKPTQIDGIRTSVNKALSSAKEWVANAAQKTKETFISGFQSARKTVAGWFGF